MARAISINQSLFPYHVSARSRNQDWYDLPMDDVWDITTHHLYFMKSAFNVRIHQYVLMANHFHLVVTTPESNISEAMGYFLKETTREIQKYSHRSNQIYGGRFHRTILEQHNYFLNTYKYVYRNPIRAGICQNVEEYTYSTLRGLLGFERLLVPVDEDVTLFSDVSDTLLWLNQPTLGDHDKLIAQALRRTKFKLPKVKRKISDLETELY
jgi:putative transposase